MEQQFLTNHLLFLEGFPFYYRFDSSFKDQNFMCPSQWIILKKGWTNLFEHGKRGVITFNPANFLFREIEALQDET
jgi:hypothetical protein